MYIHYDPVTAYRQRFSSALALDRDTALKKDFHDAVRLVSVAAPDELEIAAISGVGSIYEALRFLVDCGHDMRDIAEREADATNAATMDAVS